MLTDQKAEGPRPLTSSLRSVSASSEHLSQGAQPGAVLFDMDGTLVDSEPLWYAAEAKYVAQHGRVWTEEDALSVVGTSGPYSTARMRDKAGTDDSHEVIFSFIMDQMVDSVRSGQLKMRPGIAQLLDRLRSEHIPTALVTSSTRRLVSEVLSNLVDLSFDATVCFEDVREHKPDPEPYLVATKTLGVAPANCVALEDSPSGVKSALAAGLRVVAIPCMVEIPSQDGLSRVRSALDLDPGTLGRLTRGEVIDDLVDPRRKTA